MGREPRIPETATVTVSAAVDGTIQRKGRGPGRRAPLDYHLTVDPEVWATAQAICRPGERFVRVDDTTVRSVYTTEKRENR
jgi:hypothetical protein